MGDTICTQAEHDAIKADDERWSAQEYRGVQDAFTGDPADDLEVRNCRRCHSTLARTVRAPIAAVDIFAAASASR